MRKGTFSGITILEGEGVTEAGAAFGGQDRSIIDRLLEVGAVTHRHDAHAPLPDPIGPPSAAITTSGGAIPGDRTIYVGFTLLDSSGGETLLSDVEIETTGAQYDAPTTAPDASADYSAGSLLIGTYHYAITFTDGIGGETSIGPPVVVTRDPGYASGQVHLWGLADILTETDAAGWRLYRATGGGQYDFLAEGTSDTFTDTGAIPLNCAVHPPTLFANSTVGANLLTVVVASGSANVSSAATGFNLYLSEDGTFEDPCLYGTYPPSSAGVPIVIPSLLLLQGAPPLVSQALRGANQIDPDTELIDWHWKRPVANAAVLPPAASGTVNGDVRLALDTGLPYRYVNNAWGPWAFTITAQGSAGTSAISIVGSGEVGVSAATASGRTTWTIYAPPDDGGVGGSGVVIDSDSGELAATELAFGVYNLESDVGVGARSTVDGTGYAEILYSVHNQRGVVAWNSSAAMASGVTASDTMPLGRAFTIIAGSADDALRVRLYTDAAHRDADLSRPIGTAPTGDHGCFYERISDGVATYWQEVPVVSGANFDVDGLSVVTNDVAIAVTCLDSGSFVRSVQLTRILLEYYDS